MSSLPTMTSLSVLLVVILLRSAVVDSCAPYFDTEGWRAKADSFTEAKATQACKDAHNAIAGKSTIVGDRYCTEPELFVGRWYCAKQCKNYCDPNIPNVSLDSIHCAAMRIGSGSNGKDPDQLFITCDCAYKGRPSCSTKEATWLTVEKDYSANCSIPVLLPVCTKGAPCTTDQTCGQNGTCPSAPKSCCPVALLAGASCPPLQSVDCPVGGPVPSVCSNLNNSCLGECVCSN